MKKTFTILIAAIAAILMMALPEKVVGQTRATAGFSLKSASTAPLAANANPQTTTITGTQSETWDVSITGNWTSSSIQGSANNKYWQMGKNGSAITNATFSTTINNVTISSIVVNCASYNGIAKVNCTVGGSSFGTQNQSTPTWSNNTGGNVTFSGSNSGKIIITIDNSGQDARAAYIQSITVTYTPKLATPSLTANNGIGSVSISWGTISNAVSYTLEYANNNSFTSSTTINNISNSATSYSVTPLDAGTYYFRLKAIGNGTSYLDSNWSTTQSAASASSVTLNAPELSAVAGNGQVTVSWSDIANASSYTIWWADNSSFTGATELTNSTSPKVIGSLTNGTKYYFKAKTIGNGTTYLTSDFSDVVNATPSLPSLTTPTLTVTAGNGKVIPTWSDIDNAESYTIQYDTNNEFPSPTTKDEIESGEEITGLTNETTYYFRLKAIGDNTNYSSSSWSTTKSALPNNRQKIVIRQDSITSFTNSYNWYTWHSKDIQGKIKAYKNSGMQLNPSYDSYLYNIDDIPGTIKSVTMRKASGTDRSWTLNVRRTMMDSVSPKGGGILSLGNKTVSTTAVTWDVTGDYNYFHLKVSGGATVIDSIVIIYAPKPTHAVTIGSPSNGSITVKKNNKNIASGTQVVEDAVITLKATPADGYILNAFSVNKNGGGSVELSTDSTFVMPHDGVLVNATFGIKRTITYDANGGTGDNVVEEHIDGSTFELAANPFTAPTGYTFNGWNTESNGSGTAYAVGDSYKITADATLYAQWSVQSYNVAVSSVDNVVIRASYGVSSYINEDANANVAFGTKITLSHNLDESKTFIWDVYKTGESSTKVTVENNSFTVPAYGVTVSGEIKNIYTITFDVNGNTEAIDAVNVVEGNSIDLTANAYKPLLDGYTFKGWSETNGSATTIATPKTYTPTASKTLYAVFKKVTGSGDFSITTSGMPTSYPTSETEYTLSGHKFKLYNVANYSSVIQFKGSAGYMYNSEDFGRITEIVLNYDTYKDLDIFVSDNSQHPTTTEITPTNSGDVYTFNLSGGNYHYFTIKYNTSNAATLSSIDITYETSSDVVFVNSACTKASIAAGEIVNVGANGILTLTGANAGNASNLIIEDGGQIITSRTDVKATFKKTINATTRASYWNTISSPIGRKEISTVPNLVSGEGLTYNLYRYNETVATNQWEAYNLDNTSSSYHSDFTHLEKGHGYLYRNNGPDIEYAGTVNTEDVELTLTASASALTNLKGFNLIGNPFGQDITMSNISDVSLSGGYVLSNAGGWSPDPVATIHPCEGFLVQVAEEADITILLGTKGTTYNKEYIKFMVSNSQYEDAAFALFDDSYGLNKIEHRNPEIPMLYINKDNRDLAIATMSDNTKSFNLNFKAMTTGKYTLSYKATGEYNYLHVIDRLTGADVDMLLDGEYSFIATPNDNENRFIVRLEYMPNYSEGNEEIFAFQNGNEILVSGEGELQIFDVTGRSVMTTTISGAESINLSAQGVYIFRLIGSEIKTQKIVVR